MTLRLRLSLLTAIIVLLGLGLFGVLADLLFMRQQWRQLEDLLLLDLSRVQTLFQNQQIGARFISESSTDFVVQVVSSAGQPVLPPNAQAVLPLYEQPTLDSFEGKTLFIAAVPWTLASGAVPGTIRIGLDVSKTLLARRSLQRILLLTGLAMAFLTLLLGLLFLQRALKPLGSLAAQAKRLDPAKPQAIAYQGPEDEVAEVAQALSNALADIRKRQEAERSALAEIAHELAGPLTLVAGHLDSLAAQQNYDSRLQAAKEAARELLYTSQDLLTLSRGELERPLELEIFDLAEVVKRIAREYPGVNLVLSGTAEMAGNPQRMAQVARNLVRNAVQAGGSTAGVTLHLQRQGEQLLLEVSDKGPGITAEDLPHVFERFYTRKTKGGVGVGLSVVREIVRQHGGTVTVASSLGRGSRFVVSLPSLDTQLSPSEEMT